MSYCNRHNRTTERRFVSGHYAGGRYISSGYRDVCPECAAATTPLTQTSTDDDGINIGGIVSDIITASDTFSAPDISSSDTGGSSFDFGGGGGFDGGGGGDSF